MSWFVALSDPQGRVPFPPNRLFSSAWFESLASLSDYHGTTPAVRKNLPRLRSIPGCNEPAVDATCVKLDSLRLVQTARCMVLSQYARDIELRLKSAGLPGVVLKGPSLAHAVYPTPSDRIFTDIDLLVPRDAMAPIRDLLCEMGLSAETENDVKHASDHYGEEAFSARSSAGLDVRIELHWNLVNSPAVQKGISVVYDDLVVDGTIGLEGQLLVATVHGATGHQFDRLKFLVDTLQVLRAGEGRFDLKLLSALIRRTRTAGVVAMGCWLVHELFGCDLGMTLLKNLQLSGPARLDRYLLAPATLLQSNPSPVARFRKNVYRQRLKHTCEAL